MLTRYMFTMQPILTLVFDFEKKIRLSILWLTHFFRFCSIQLFININLAAA